MGSESQTGDDKLLSYGDILLRRSDIDLLKGPCWLNDQIMTFYFDYLCTETFAKERNDLLFVGGAMTFLLKELAGTNDISSIVAPLKLASRKLVLLAVNNNPDCSMAEGGSHWTLLVYSRKNNRFSHYDSSPGSSNVLVAKQIAAVLQPFVDCQAKDSKVHAALTPTQTNAYDCGVYVLACAELVATQWTQNLSQKDTESAMKQQLTPGVIANKRSQILSLIQAKAASFTNAKEKVV